MSGTCENCGGIIRGSGKRYCSYCRNSREVKETREESKKDDLIESAEITFTNEKTKELISKFKKNTPILTKSIWIIFVFVGILSSIFCIYAMIIGNLILFGFWIILAIILLGSAHGITLKRKELVTKKVSKMIKDKEKEWTSFAQKYIKDIKDEREKDRKYKESLIG